MIQPFYLIIWKSFRRLVQKLGPELPKNQTRIMMLELNFII